MSDHDPAVAVSIKRSSWEERLVHVQRQFPSTAKGTWAGALEDVAVMGALVKTLIQVANAPVKRGNRPMPDAKVGMEQLRALVGDSYTCEPFAPAMRFLALDRRWSVTMLARKTGFSRSQVHRLMAGDVKPTAAQIEAVAKAFDKAPEFFSEYRTAAVCALFADYLTASPETSVGILRQLREVPSGPSRPAGGVMGPRPATRQPR